MCLVCTGADSVRAFLRRCYRNQRRRKSSTMQQSTEHNVRCRAAAAPQGRCVRPRHHIARKASKRQGHNEPVPRMAQQHSVPTLDRCARRRRECALLKRNSFALLTTVLRLLYSRSYGCCAPGGAPTHSALPPAISWLRTTARHALTCSAMLASGDGGDCEAPNGRCLPAACDALDSWPLSAPSSSSLLLPPPPPLLLPPPLPPPPVLKTTVVAGLALLWSLGACCCFCGCWSLLLRRRPQCSPLAPLPLAQQSRHQCRRHWFHELVRGVHACFCDRHLSQEYHGHACCRSVAHCCRVSLMVQLLHHLLLPKLLLTELQYWRHHCALHFCCVVRSSASCLSSLRLKPELLQLRLSLRSERSHLSPIQCPALPTPHRVVQQMPLEMHLFLSHSEHAASQCRQCQDYPSSGVP
ncbi:hypothetical protein JKP88DRAFT_309984 [Tribonema minus]|uniref:Uncharacterized protein n=1 Tax=Tribonema minus TaxID=303371 RepID=A0A835Z2Z0_9STRA|nr:hypothetical protein JKP88DRAFT_309984 [Tribonema minus]